MKTKLYASGDKEWGNAWGFSFKKQKGTFEWFHFAWKGEFAG